ncbi:MAG: branched-chain amino acid ABC transporter permease [Alphaproteobacteria bacterium]|nr:branched-chain amino acid ABC transporter permease [Alphaproteobacteria bacterium]
MLFVQLLINGIFAGSIYALLGLSFATIFSTTKIWHFAQGAVYTLGAYVILAASLYGKLPFALAAGLGVVAAAGLGALSIAVLYRPLQRRGASSLVMVMASLGAMVIADNLIVLGFGPTGYSIDVAVPDTVSFGSLLITGGQMVAPLTALVIVGLYMWFLFRSVNGRRMRALIDNEELLLLNGVDTGRLQMLAFAIGSALLPCAAALSIVSGSGISPYFGIQAVLTGAMAMFFGGVDSIEGAAVAGLALGIIESLAAFILPTEWQTAVTYALVLVFLMVRPTGLFGRSLPKTSL